jgi:hypothetical protein
VIFANPVEIEVSDPAKFDRAAVEKTLTDGGFTVKKVVQQ